MFTALSLPESARNDLRQAAGKKLWHECYKPAVTEDSNLGPLPRQRAARGSGLRLPQSSGAQLTGLVSSSPSDD